MLIQDWLLIQDTRNRNLFLRKNKYNNHVSWNNLYAWIYNKYTNNYISWNNLYAWINKYTPEAKTSPDQACSCPRDWRVPAIMAAQTSQYYGIEGFMGDPQLGSHYTERHQSSVRKTEIYIFKIYISLISVCIKYYFCIYSVLFLYLLCIISESIMCYLF